MSFQQLIGLVGPKGSGKTTLSYTLELKGFKRTHFAAPLKEMLATLLRYQGASDYLIKAMLYGSLKEESTELLAFKTPRLAMQTLGSEWRDLIDRNLWTQVWRNRVESRYKPNKMFKVVVDDMRFIHEADLVKSMGGKVVLVARPGHGPSDHTSEREYLEIVPDFTITNDRGIPHMIDQINYFLSEDVP